MYLYSNVGLRYIALAMMDKGQCCTTQEEQLQSSQGLLLPAVMSSLSISCMHLQYDVLVLYVGLASIDK